MGIYNILYLVKDMGIYGLMIYVYTHIYVYTGICIYTTWYTNIHTLKYIHIYVHLVKDMGICRLLRGQIFARLFDPRKNLAT